MAESDHLSIIEFDMFQRGARPRQLTYLEAEELGDEIDERRRAVYGLLGQMIFCLHGIVIPRISSEADPDFPNVLSERVTIAMIGDGKNVEQAHETVSAIVHQIVRETPEYDRKESDRF